MRRGEIWLINLDPTLDAEIKKSRPAIIISENSIGILPLRVIVPLTEWKERYSIAPWIVKIMPIPENGLSKPSAADTFQVRSVSTERFIQRLGQLTTPQIKQIVEAIKIVIGAEA